MIRKKRSVLYTVNVLKFSDLMLNSSSANSAMGEGAAPLPAKFIQNICFAEKVTGNKDTHVLQRGDVSAAIGCLPHSSCGASE